MSVEVQFNLTLQLQYNLARMKFPRHHKSPFQDRRTGQVLGGKDTANVIDCKAC